MGQLQFSTLVEDEKQASQVDKVEVGDQDLTVVLQELPIEVVEEAQDQRHQDLIKDKVEKELW